MTFVDTAHLVALAMPEDHLHDRAMRWSRSIDETFLTTDFVLVEFLNALSKPHQRPSAFRFFRWLSEDPNVNVIEASRKMIAAGVELYRQRADKAWSLTDCISFNTMHEHGVTQALTHDHHFEQAGFEALLRKEPPVA